MHYCVIYRVLSKLPNFPLLVFWSCTCITLLFFMSFQWFACCLPYVERTRQSRQCAQTQLGLVLFPQVLEVACFVTHLQEVFLTSRFMNLQARLEHMIMWPPMVLDILQNWKYLLTQRELYKECLWWTSSCKGYPGLGGFSVERFYCATWFV